MKFLYFFVPVYCLWATTPDDAAISSKLVSAQLDLSNTDVVSRQITAITSAIKSKEAQLAGFVKLSNSRKVQSPDTMLKDANTVLAREAKRKQANIQDANRLRLFAEKQRNFAKKIRDCTSTCDAINLQLQQLNDQKNTLTALVLEQGNLADLQPQQLDDLNNNIAMLEGKVLTDREFYEQSAAQNEQLDEKLKEIDAKIEALTIKKTEQQHFISTLLAEGHGFSDADLHFFQGCGQRLAQEEEPGEALGFYTVCNLPGHKASRELALQKSAEAKESMRIAFNNPDCPENIRKAFYPVAESAQPLPAAAIAEASPELNRYNGINKYLTREEFLHYAALEKERRALKRTACVLSSIFSKMLMQAETVKKKDSISAARVRKKEPSKMVLTAAEKKQDQALRAKEQTETKKIMAQKQEQDYLEAQREAEARETTNSVNRVLRKQEKIHVDPVAPQPVPSLVPAIKPDVAYLTYCVETTAFSDAFEQMNEKTQVAVETVINDLMLDGQTARSRGVMKGISCTVNARNLFIAHADYMGAKARLFYTIYDAQLILLQAGSHDFDSKNGTVTIN